MKNDKMEEAKEDESLPKRRKVLRGLTAGLTSAVGLSGAASAGGTNGEEQVRTKVETLEVDVDSALQKLDTVIGSPLFEALVSEGYLSEQSIEEFPSHRLDDDSKPGGVTRLRVNGELEQLNFHKVIDGKRLEVNLPLSDYEPKAVIHEDDGNSKVYHYGNQFQGKSINNGPDGSVSPTDHCSGFRYCTTCAACCGYDNWQRIEEKIECSNCWVGHCQWVKIGCC